MAKRQPGPLTIDQAADSIINWAYSDSCVKLDRTNLIDMLRDDYDHFGRFPTEKECETMVTGNDEGEVPRELEVAFPSTCDYILAFWS